MNYKRLFAMGVILTFALAVLAHQNGSAKGAHPHSMPSVDEHLKTLSEKLSLSSDQQSKIRPVLQEMHSSAHKLMLDQSLSQEERRAKHKELVQAADEKIRPILSDEQKRKLDELEQESHMK